MRSRLPLFLSLAVMALLFPLVIHASGFQLKTIGNLNVSGVNLSQIWYTNGNNLGFTGLALENAAVIANIDGTAATVNADAAGNWSYMTSLSEGDHQINFTSNESTIAFTLTIGEPATGAGSLPTTETPTVGIMTPTIIAFISGLFLTFLPLILKKLLVPV